MAVRAGNRGSGWVIGELGILTARHVVAPFLGEARSCLAIPDPWTVAAAYDCEVVWEDQDRDLALLRVRDTHTQSWTAAVDRGIRPTLADPGTTAATAYVVGYPDVALDEDDPQPELARGVLLPAEGGVSGWMPFEVDSSVPDTSPLWRGMSGAALRDLHGRLLGVVVEVDDQHQRRRLYAATVPDPATDAGFAAALTAVGAAPFLEAADAPQARDLLALLDPTGRPYPVADVVDLGEFGVRVSRTDIDTHGDPYYPYVPRAADMLLAEALDRRVRGADPRVLLVVGEAMTGKSRTLAEALREHPVLSSSPLLKPRPQADLRRVAQFVTSEGGVLWLDDLNARLATVDSAVVRDLLAVPGLVIVGALRADQLRLLQGNPELRLPWDLLTDERLVEHLPLAQRWTPQEQEGLRGAETDVRDTVRQGSPLGEVLGAADELRKRLTAGTPRLQALVQLVADWARTGLPKHVPETVAEQLWEAYLHPAESQALVDLDAEDREQAFRDALAWACQAVAGSAALLTRTEQGLAAEDYLIGLRTDQQAQIPLPVWRNALKEATQIGANSATMLELGYRAAIADITDIARRAWDQLAAGSTDAAPAAAVNLGMLLAEQGNAAGALAAYQRAIESGHAEAAPTAAVKLGSLLAERGIPGGARAAYQRAIDSGHANYAPAAWVNLGLLLAEQGDVAGAGSAFQRAIDSGHAAHAPAAWVNLGVLLAGQGDVAGAGSAFQRAIDSGHPDTGAMAAANLGVLLAGQGDVAGARSAFQRAIDSGHPDAAPVAARYVEVLLDDREQ